MLRMLAFRGVLMRMRVQHRFEKTALPQINHATRITNYYPHRPWQVLSAHFRCLPMAFAITRQLFLDR